MCKVSVITITYNRKHLLPRAVYSVLKQTFADFEYIIVNNGSDDNTRNLCDDYEKKDKRVKIIHKGKGNIGSGRNAGLLAAKGEYIIFIDDDDTAEPDMLEFLYNLVISHNADISICGSWRSTDGVVTDKYVFDEILELDTEQAIVELLKRERYNVAFPCKLIRRELLSHPPFAEHGSYDDITTAHKVLANVKKVVIHGLPKYTFYRHSNNNSAFSTNHQLLNPEILGEYLKAYRERTEYLCGRFPAIKDYVEYSEWSFMISMCEKIKRYKITECEKQFMMLSIELNKNKENIKANQFLKDFERVWFDELQDVL